MLYGLETVALSKRQEVELEVAELKMLRFSLGVMKIERITKEFIRGTVHVGRFGDEVEGGEIEMILTCAEKRHIGRRMLRMELPGSRKRGRPRRRFMDVVKEDMHVVGVTEADVEDRGLWRRMIRCGDP
ncbi:hypothetical protein HF521_021372 [Silurus meridionalis]|uniref:Uncharacterized protein n=1 Tax=Silurus meridionalis TaxID=175797 RepID=A0A8T0BFW3_SILME|nr:hypothetical protein HF521_021372 [Silurus meridionalis]